MSDQQQILRLLATIREEVANIRSRQEELYEILLSYKDQIHEVKRTVEEGLEGLPKSPYIAGALVPAPGQVEGVDEFTQLLATYLHKAPPVHDDTPPRDVQFEPDRPARDEEIELEPDEDRERRRGRNGGRGGGRPRDSDLERGPDRDIELLDLDDEGKKKKRRPRRRKKTGKSEAASD